MSDIIVIYLIMILITFFLISKISYFLNLVDLPNKRKMHSRPTANTGGLALGFIYIFSIYLFDFTDQ